MVDAETRKAGTSLSMKFEIEIRFNGNLERVEHLVDLPEALAAGRGRRPVDTSDILRSIRCQGESVRQEKVWTYRSDALGRDEWGNVEFIVARTPEEDAANSAPSPVA